MIHVRCRYIDPRCQTQCVASERSSTIPNVSLFGISRDGASRFYARARYVDFKEVSGSTHSGTTSGCGLLVFDSDTRLGCTNIYTLRDKQISPKYVLSRELWMTAELPDHKECGLFVMRQTAGILLFDLQSAVKAFEFSESSICLLENEKRDPRVLNLTQNGKSFRFRMNSIHRVPTSRGCVLAINDVHIGTETTTLPLSIGMSRCRDMTTLLSIRLDLRTISDLLGYMECTGIQDIDDAMILLTICECHCVIRVLPESNSHRSSFEATLVCPRANRDSQ